MKNNLTFVLGFALLAISTSSIIARFLPEVSSTVISLWRLSFASLFVWLYSFFVPQKEIIKKDIIPLIISGILLGLHFIFFYQAIKLTSIANATLLATTAPMFTFLVEKFVFKIHFKQIVIFGFIIALVGTIIITGSNGSSFDGFDTGKLFGLAAAACIAVVYLIATKIREHTSTISYTRYLYLIAAIFLFAIASMNGENIFELKKSSFLLLLALGVFPTILGHSLLYYGLKFMSPTTISSVPLGEPIVASLFAWIIFSERVPSITLAGGVLILFGVYLIIAKSSKKNLYETY